MDIQKKLKLLRQSFAQEEKRLLAVRRQQHQKEFARFARKLGYESLNELGKAVYAANLVPKVTKAEKKAEVTAAFPAKKNTQNALTSRGTPRQRKYHKRVKVTPAIMQTVQRLTLEGKHSRGQIANFAGCSKISVYNIQKKMGLLKNAGKLPQAKAPKRKLTPGGRRAPTPEPIRLAIIEQLTHGDAVPVIARRMGVGETTIYAIRKKEKIPPPPRDRISLEEENAVVELLKSHSIRAVAKLLDMTPSTVQRVKKKAGLVKPAQKRAQAAS